MCVCVCELSALSGVWLSLVRAGRASLVWIALPSSRKDVFDVESALVNFGGLCLSVQYLIQLHWRCIGVQKYILQFRSAIQRHTHTVNFQR